MYVHYVQNININSIIFLLITVVAILVKHPKKQVRLIKLSSDGMH